MSDDKVIEGLKLIRHTGTIRDQPDDPSYPFRLVVDLRPPNFMEVTWALLHGGSEEIVVRSLTLEALNDFVERNDFCAISRFRCLTITGPAGVLSRVER